ncbi:type II toxin-antitoxin system HicB family antitoxin [Acinetobacter sp. BMW17]|uniref:type II toxin-antitoxin system HicB family antitoxin n=1 Tax=Acinetobacter TaxID=469 RepID=UPI000AB645EA|nr:type II toxin-antitoxin system HicB family antitoxin [Acinetobacter sp. BMW17]
METMKYKDFDGSIETSYEDRIMFGKILFINDLIMYEGNSIDELEQSFHEAVDSYLEFCEKNEKSPDKPMNGVFNVRTSPDLHKKLSLKALQMGCSLNACVNKALENFTDNPHDLGKSIDEVSQTLVSINSQMNSLVTVDHFNSYNSYNDNNGYQVTTSIVNTKLRIVS